MLLAHNVSPRAEKTHGDIFPVPALLPMSQGSQRIQAST